MKIGMIFECGPDGADEQVCIGLANRVIPVDSISPVTLDNKPKLIRDCGKAAKTLLHIDKCQHVFIIWDLYPAWRERGARPCRKEDRDGILESLKGADVNPARVTLVCIEEELESWLIADHRALSSVLSTDAHKMHFKRIKKPEQERNPKRTLMRMFSRSHHRAYFDRRHAIQIVKALPDLGFLTRLSTFRRFSEKLVAVNR
jgi:hypothetical protein